MKKFFTAGRNLTAYHTVQESLTQSLTGGTLGSSEATKQLTSMIDFESLTPTALEVLGNTEINIANSFEDAGVTQWLMGLVGTDKEDHPSVEAGLEQMVNAAIAINDTEAYFESYQNPSKGTGDQTILGSETSFDMEGFDNLEFNKFAIESIMSAGATMALSPFANTFFKPVIVPPGQSGKDIKITIPMVYSRSYRTGSGTPFNFKQTSLVKAALDHTILEANSTNIVPVADNGNASFLVPANVVANTNVSVGDITVATRPLLYGTAIDLLGVSNNANIVLSGAQTEMDTLDPMVSIGVQYVSFTIGTTTLVMKLDVTRLSGALLNDMAEGVDGDKATTYEGSIWLNSSDLLTDGSAAVASDITSTLGLAAGTEWRAMINLRIHATLKMLTGEMRTDFAEASFGDVFTGDDFATDLTGSTEHSALVTATTFAGVGFMPSARRSNTNMRDLGTIVDTGRTYNFRLACPTEAPISSVKPLTVLGGGVGMDVLSATKRLRNLGTAVTAILDAETRLIATAGMEHSTGTIGELLVTPTYSITELDLSAQVATMQSVSGLADLQAVLVNSVTMAANELILDGGYRTALELYTGNANAFEVNVACDPLVANLLQINGESRTLGNGRPFSISPVDDTRFRNRIYITLSRTDVTGADPLSFGAHLSAASLIFKAQTTRLGATATETHLLPREAFRVLLPLLSVITVVGLQGYFTTNND